jgi:uncharacterized radical SAM superfamily protein
MTMNFDISRVYQLIRELKGLDESLKDAMISAFDVRYRTFKNAVQFFPHPFTPVSITGTHCDLDCKHCSTHYLEHMVDAHANSLYHIASNLIKRGEKGVLLSGGSRLDGSVPTYEQQEIISSVKSLFHLKISAHTGLINRQQALKLKGYGLDMALVDIIGSKNTIHDVYGLTKTPEDYDITLAHLSNQGIALAPHIIVGLHGGVLDGEFKALEMVRKYDPDVVVIVVFIPTQGTDYEDAPKPDITDVIRVITSAREMFPSTPLSLSCVRPGGRYRSMLDTYALLSGIDRVAVPSRQCYQTAEKLGLVITEIDNMCCSYGGDI